MSCSSKYEKLVEYLKTHYTYQLKLNRFAIGNNEELDSKIKREVYKNIMEFVENLETQEELQEKQKNNLIPVDFGTPAGADTISLNFTTDPITFGEQKTYPVTLGGSDTDTLNFGSPIPGGMGEDHISFNSTSRNIYNTPNYGFSCKKI